ncbi:antibiotic biosynthesis monooxygenase [uncultured Shewanella sp.]|uniref:putative quinol monooxygenase n=1 Tax=uncultured Shewanella sp. TaxID=173975 RepID=UPI00261543E5|nr:antibiotic biosynthesis monooxygenase [uncultured Shewanella sp.]
MLNQGLFITAEIRIKPETDLHTGINAIHAFCEGMNSESGCSMAIALQDTQDPYRFVFWERYDDKAAFEAHFNAQHTQTFIQSGLTELVQAFESQKLLKED